MLSKAAKNRDSRLMGGCEALCPPPPPDKRPWLEAVGVDVGLVDEDVDLRTSRTDGVTLGLILKHINFSVSPKPVGLVSPGSKR